MRIIVMFDLPMQTTNERREYSKFRKFLINNGFIMMQKSIYTKLVINTSNMRLIKKKINDNKPKYGIVQVLNITEKQYSDIDYIVGQSNNNSLNSIDRLVIL